jgi:predicted Zn-dependent protease
MWHPARDRKKGHRAHLWPVAGWALAAAIAGAPVRGGWAQGTELTRQWDDLRKAQQAYERGLSAQARGDEEEASAAFSSADLFFRRVLQQNPQRTDLYAPLGDILIRRGQAAAAYVLLNKQVREGSTDAGVRWQLARALHGIRQTRRALATAQQAAEADPKNPAIQAFIAERAIELGEDRLAVPILRRLLPGATDKDAARYRRLLAQGLARTGQGAEAVTLLEETLRQHSGDKEATRALALVLCQTAEPASPAFDRGVSLARALLGERPADEDLLRGLGGALLRRGRAAEALPLFRRHAAARPGDADAALLLGQALTAAGQAAEAVAVLAPLSAAGRPQALAALGRAHLSSHPPNLAAAAQALGRATQQAPADLDACLDHVAALHRLAQAPRALDEARRCVALSPQHPATLWARGALEAAAGKRDEATATLREALAKAQGQGQADLPQTLIEALAPPARDRAGAAVAVAVDVIRGSLSRALLQRGLALLAEPPQAGRPPAALAPLREAHQLAPGAASARALALAHLAAGSKGDAQEAARLLRPLAEERGADAATLGAYARALREADQPKDALAVLTRAAALPAGKPLAAALRMERALTLLALGRPAEACAALGRPDGDEAGERLLAQASLMAARQALSASPGPPPAGAGPAAAAASGQGPLPFLQTAARLRARLSVPERAEAELLQILALTQTDQADVALRRLPAIEAEFGPEVLKQLLGPGGFDDLQARVALRAGQLQQGTIFAQRAIAAQPPGAAQELQATLAAAYVERAIAAYERADYERAGTLLRAPSVQALARGHGQAQAAAQGKPAGKAPARAAATLLLYNQGALLLARGQTEEALAIFNKLDSKDLPERWIALGAHAEVTGDRRAALESYGRYLQAAAEGPAADRVRRWVELLERFYSSGTTPQARRPPLSLEGRR